MSLARNALFNLLGAAVPAVAALLTVPILVAHLGTQQYGVLILVTSIVGYFAILDVNVTAGSVKYISEFHARGEDEKVREVFTFGTALYLGIGLLGGALIIGFARPLAGRVFQIPDASLGEAELALRWAGAAFAIGQLQFYLQSVPQALERYDITGRLESVFGTLVPVATMVVAVAGGGLVGVVVVRLMLSLVNIAVLANLLRRLLPGLAIRWPTARIARSLGNFSAFSYLARLAAISAANTDKLFIGAVVDMRSLALYSVPFLLANRVFALAFRLAQVIFPKASALASVGRTEELRSTYLQVLRYIVFINGSFALLLAGLAPELLHYWAGKDFGGDAVFVMSFIVAAIFVDSLTNLPSLVNDGLGHPRNSGVAAVLRAGVGLGAAWFAIHYAGIAGAAVAQLCVSIVATISFTAYVHGRTVPVTLKDAFVQGVLPSSWLILAGVVAGIGANFRPLLPPMVFGAAAALLVMAIGLFGWLVILHRVHRARALHAARRLWFAAGGPAAR